uniref:Actin depolymerising venom protein gelsolin 1 n=1 Tax=Platymeris rhadamanthus TaxID=1134088 RepID=GELS1_PLARH|nr:RecName: Full=Actin depolymerising venom protein gelsolin 1; Flags: Precursor [Platymeris rhadamanthus]QHB21506.1 venom gelsolin 1 [Platymeris rhadamanthus]
MFRQMKLGSLATKLLLACFLVTCTSGLDIHPNLIGAGQKEGIEIWRIETFVPVPVPKSEYGKFHEGDSYIVLSTKEDKSKKGIFTWDIYYWLGKSTTQDESGTAAVLTVELDDALGKTPVQHREIQGQESEQFVKLFPGGVKYLPGGIDSGFKHTDTNAPGQKKLYQVKGAKYIRVRQVELSAKSLNNGDCFILDTGSEVYVWVGKNSQLPERLKATKAANQIKELDHRGRGKVFIVDASSTSREVKEFFTKLGSGSPSEVANTSEDDQEYEKKQDAMVTLYKVSDASGKLVTEKLSEKPLKQSMLKSEDCFVLDTVTSGVFVWIGRNSSIQEKIEAFKKGLAFLKDNKHPTWTQMQRIVDGGEPTAFKEYFLSWKN